MGDLGPLMRRIGAHATHGVSETHLLHHVCSRIPHYHAWEASQALKKRLAEYGYTRTEGGAVGWAELYRVYRECKVRIFLAVIGAYHSFSSLKIMEMLYFSKTRMGWQRCVPL